MLAPATSIARTSDGERGYLEKKTADSGNRVDQHHVKKSNITQTEVTLTDLLHTYAVASYLPFFESLCCELDYVHKIKMAYNREEVCGRGS